MSCVVAQRLLIEFRLPHAEPEIGLAASDICGYRSGEAPHNGPTRSVFGLITMTKRGAANPARRAGSSINSRHWVARESDSWSYSMCNAWTSGEIVIAKRKALLAMR